MKYRMRVTAAAVGLAAVGALAAACGGGSSSSGTASGGGTGTNGGNAFQAYVSCLQQNGVTISMPTARPSGMGGPGMGMRPSGAPPSGFARGGFGGGFPGGGMFSKPSNVSQATWDKAQSACASLRPSTGPRGGGDSGAAAAYRNCLSNHGVTASTGTLNTADPTVVAAEKACSVLRPSVAPSAG